MKLIKESMEDLSTYGNKVYVAKNQFNYNIIAIIIDEENKKYQLVNGQQLKPGRYPKKSAKAIRDMADELSEKGYERVRNPQNDVAYKGKEIKESKNNFNGAFYGRQDIRDIKITPGYYEWILKVDGENYYSFGDFGESILAWGKDKEKDINTILDEFEEAENEFHYGKHYEGDGFFTDDIESLSIDELDALKVELGKVYDYYHEMNESCKESLSKEDLEIIKQSKKDWVKTKDDEKTWNSLSDEDKYLLAMSGDMGTWFDEIQGNEELENRYYELKAMFSKEKKSIKEELNMEFSREQIVKTILNVFGFSISDSFLDTTVDVVERAINYAEDDDLYDAVFRAMDESLMYTEDQWSMMAFYQSPSEANFDNAWEDYQSDIVKVLRELGIEEE